MPTYVYACDACGNQFEQFQSFKESPLDVCPCGQQGKVRRVFQPVGIVFKGSGWYINDSRKKGESSSSTSSASNTNSTDSSENTGATAESKAEPKAEPKAEAKADTTT